MSADTQPRKNRLAHETSPYLIQHADNPVDWYPWGEEALARARAENKPILLSVGYAACHWCHVMAHESFENEATAEIMNRYFINIKVDREERPDIDHIYMTAVQAMTNHGGWPMTVFLLPDGTPFYGGTYYPPEDRHQMPAFRRVLVAVADAFAQRQADLQEEGRKLIERIRTATATQLESDGLTPQTLDEAYAVLHGQFDQTFGGFGRAPKFPQPMVLEFLLRYGARTGNALALQMLDTTLRAMAEGGMYDQIGGGFHRYSVDAQWLVPHFEKMLYDNALLTRVYLEAYQASSNPFHRRIAQETLDYVLREMTHPDGGFFSTQDADSLPHAEANHNEEGAFFVWTPAELREVLGGDALIFAQLYDVSERGNFEGRNILHVRRRPEDIARVTGLSVAQIDDLITRSKQRLFAARLQRPLPGLDNKILTAWNGMMLRAFALASRVLQRNDYLEAARRNAEFLLRELRRPDGTLLRTWKDGHPGPTPAFLEDYALLADGLLALYEATFEPRWLLESRALADTILARFWDADLGGFYDTASDHEQLVVRPRSTDDNATPSGSSVAADLLMRLGLIFDEARYRDHAAAVIGSMQPLMERYPIGFGRYLSVAEWLLHGAREIVIVGDPQATETQAMINALFAQFVPNRVVLLLNPNDPPPLDIPLLEARTQINGQTTAYVCQNYVCRLPVTDVEGLLREVQS